MSGTSHRDLKRKKTFAVNFRSVNLQWLYIFSVHDIVMPLLVCLSKFLRNRLPKELVHGNEPFIILLA